MGFCSRRLPHRSGNGVDPSPSIARWRSMPSDPDLIEVFRSSVDPRFVSPGSLDRSVPFGDRDLVRGISELAQDSFRMLPQNGRRHTV